MANRSPTQDDQTIHLNFDGLCEPKNPGGVATYGFVIRSESRKLHEERGLAFAEPWTSEASNNVAEYSGLIHGLEWLRANGMTNRKVIVIGDSKLVISQLNGTFKVKAPRLLSLFKRARDLLMEFDKIEIQWLDRSLNAEADLLSRIAYHQFLKKSKDR